MMDPEERLGLILCCIALVAFLFWCAHLSGKHAGAELVHTGEWVCEVALDKVHCGPRD